MPYRTVAKWDIDIGPINETRGLSRMFGYLYKQEFGIKFRDQETRFTIKTSNLMTLREIERLLPQLARIRYQHHHKYGTGNDYGRPFKMMKSRRLLKALASDYPAGFDNRYTLSPLVTIYRSRTPKTY